jgi:hypothetical protein
MDEQMLELIHGEVDGKLDAEQRQALRRRLAESAEARLEYQRVRALSEQLEILPEFEVPRGMRDSILAAVAAPAPVGQARQRHVTRLGLVAALAATAAGVALVIGRGPEVQELDPSVLAGTIGRPALDAGRPALRLAGPGVTGTILLHHSSDGLAIEVELDADRPVQLIASAAGASLDLKGYVRIDGAPAEMNTVDGTLSVLHTGRQHYALVLEVAAAASEIDLAVYDGRELLKETRLLVPPSPVRGQP